MLAALGIEYTFYTFAIRKKICSIQACKKLVANLINKTIAADEKLAVFVNQELTSSRLGIRIELSKC